MPKIITSKDWRGVVRTLKHDGTGEPIVEGQVVTNERHGKFIVSGGRAPHKDGSSGKVWTDKGEFFPSVIDCKWV